MPTPCFDKPVPFWKLYLRMGGWFSVAFFVVLAALTIGSHIAHGFAERFETEGRRTQAEVLDKEISESTDSDGDTTYTYYLTLAYSTNTGEDIVKDSSVSKGFYWETDIGDFIPILYLESQPRRIETNEGSNRTAGQVMQIIGLVDGLLFLGAFWYSGRRAVAAIRARRYGARESVTVAELYATSVTVNNRRRYRLKWRDAQGKVGYSLMYPKDALLPYPPGHRITIYQGIKKAFWEGDVGPRPE
ncbi:DUF3592 domain-containing protein [Pacificoceanicola onchidii]|uniref:DUF3592 domain-containing protein n=1 Tax=Pacificoceanicola onchidii TaxID=2562685 RepID=UPI0010A427DA|nr:DUF3592 domain-containing protein [Pacificoceanicola onchidii]